MSRRRTGGAVVRLLAAAVAVGACGVIARAVDGPSTGNTAVAAMEGTPATAEDVAKVDAVVKRWLTGPKADPDVADVALQRIASPGRWAAIVQAAARADLPPKAREFFTAYVERERPREAARARAWARSAAWNDFNIGTAKAAWTNAGHHDPKWDAAAGRAVDEFFRPRRDAARTTAASDEALALGCDDPFILYLSARQADARGGAAAADAAAATRLADTYARAATGMAGTQYPAYRRYLAGWYAFQRFQDALRAKARAGEALPEGAGRQLDTMAHAFMDLWPDLVKTPGVPEHELSRLASEIVEIDLDPKQDRRRFYDPVHGALTAALPNSAVPHLIEAKFYVKYAWDARGGGWANTVTPEGWKLMGERLAAARQALEKAHAIDPNNGEVPAQMLVVALGENWPVDRMDAWFERAVAADPDQAQAYLNKLYYLEPKWHGSLEQMLTFGHECLATRNYSGNVAFRLIDALERVLTYVPAEQQEAFLQIPAVWEDVHALYEPFCKAEPEETFARSSYCFWACRTGHWDEAARQFELLGDRAVPARFGGKAAMDRFRVQAMERGVK